MRILVLGGTAWLGREAAAHGVAAGHDVVCLARGTAGAAADGAHLVVGDRDREDGLAAVAGERWDVVLDVARQPGHVRRAARDLPDVGHYVYVSSISAYLPPERDGIDESAPLREPLEGDVMTSMETYGEAKVACEQHLLGVFGDRASVLRAGLIGGPGDWSDRTTYWPSRFHRGDDPVLVPDAPDLATAVVDVRDLAAWMLTCGTERIGGTFNVPGVPHTFVEHLATAARVGGFSGTTVAAGEQWLEQHEVGTWFGPRSLPIWLTGEDRYLTAASGAAAQAAGLTMRTLEATLADGLAWRSGDPDRAWGSGLTREDEQALLAELT